MANRKILTLMLVAFIATFFPLSPSTAQNLPPSGAYQPIPNYTGTNAGLLFRNAINNRFSGAQPISPAIVSLSFANLPAEQDGTLFYCVDCQKVSPCGGGGAGAWAMGQNGAWSCATSASNLSMGGDVTGASNANTVSTVLGGKTPVVTSGANAASGTSTAAALNSFNIAGRIDVTNPKYGAVCSTTTESAAATASNPVVTVGAIGDFKVGQYVKLDHAGVSNTIATPTLTSVTLNSFGYNDGPGSPNFQYNTFDGQCNTDTATNATGHNTSCTTVYGYAIRATGQTGIGSGLNGMWSAQSNIVYATGAAAVLSIGNNNVLQWTDDANATGYVIQRCTGASCTPSGIQAVKQVGIIEGGITPPADIYFDFGNGFGVAEDSEGSSASAWAADDDAQITNISGLSITLSVAPGQTGSFTMRHDDAPAFQSAANASCLSGAQNCSAVYVPACVYPYPLSQAVSLWGMTGSGFQGANSVAWVASPSQLQWDGPVGGRIINGNYSSGSKISRLELQGPNNSPGAFIDINRYGTSSPSTQGPGAPASIATTYTTPSHWKVENIECGGNVSLCVNIGGGSNDENNVFDDVTCDDGFGSTGGLACFYSDSQETYNETFNDSSVTTRDFGIDFYKVGSFQLRNTNFFGNGVDIYSGVLSATGEMDGGVSEGSQAFSDGWGILGVSNFDIGPMNSNPSGVVIIAPNPFSVWTDDVIGQCNGSACDTNIGCGQGGRPCGTWIGDTFGLSLQNHANSWTDPPQPGALPFTDGSGENEQPNYTAINSGVGGGPSTPSFVPYAQFIESTNATGTAGYAFCTMNNQGTIKVVSCKLSGYQETGAAQTVGFASGGSITLPGMNFTTAPNIVQSSCTNTGATAASATTSALTLPAGASMTAESCNITAIGQ